MSKIARVSKKCCCCGEVNDFLELEKSDSSGFMDLDTRPLMMARSTLILEPLMTISHKILTSIF